MPAEYRAFITTIANGGLGLLSLEYSLANPVATGINCRVSDDFFKTPFIHTSAYNSNEDPYIIELGEKCDRQEISQAECDRVYDYSTAGTMIIYHGGCGYYHRLVITGATRGQIWLDGDVDDQGYLPLNMGFLDWFENN